MGEELGGDWTHVYVWLSSSAVHLKLLPTVLTGYTAVQNKHFKNQLQRRLLLHVTVYFYTVLLVGTVEIMWHFKASFLLFRPTLLSN